MNSFNEFVSAVQVGVRRSAPPSGPLGIEGSPEATTLIELGALGLMRRAGAKGGPCAALPESPPEEKRIAHSAPIREAIGEKLEEALIEWANEAARRGFVAPHASLAELIGLPKKVRGAIWPVLGERGRWLAQFMGVAFEPPIVLDPEIAREELRTEYETFDDREIVVRLNVLGAGDEATLLRALADRRKGVREAAVDRLITIPSSFPALELKARSEKALIVRRSLLRTSLEVVPPEQEGLPKWLPRMGARSGFGPAALALMDVIRRVPPGIEGHSPSDLIDRAIRSDYKQALLEGWQEAAHRFEDRVWIDELFRHAGKDFELRGDLFPKVSEATFDAVTIETLRNSKELGRALTWVMLRNRPLSPELSRAIVETARRGLGAPTFFYGLTFTLSPSVLPLLQQPWAEEAPLEQLREHLWKVIDLRHRLLESLR